jgi:hypothetical protein
MLAFLKIKIKGENKKIAGVPHIYTDFSEKYKPRNTC